MSKANSTKPKPINPENGDLYTIKKFTEYCKEGYLIDSDGSGKYSDGISVYPITACPSDIKAGKIEKRFSHVVWYPK